MRLDWKKASLIAGQDTLFIAPLTPTSIASLAIPAMSYGETCGAGFLRYAWSTVLLSVKIRTSHCRVESWTPSPGTRQPPVMGANRPGESSRANPPMRRASPGRGAHAASNGPLAQADCTPDNFGVSEETWTPGRPLWISRLDWDASSALPGHSTEAAPSADSEAASGRASYSPARSWIPRPG